MAIMRCATRVEHMIRSGLLGAMVLAVSLGTAAAQNSPASETLLAATVRASDVSAIRLAPGGWWDDAPEFNDRMDPDGPPGALDFVYRHVFGKPDDDPAEVATALTAFADPADAAADFERRAESDRKLYGEPTQGPSVGDQSRYMRRSAGKSGGAAASLRFRSGRFIVRIDANGAAAHVSADTLAKLGGVVVDRLSQIETGKLSPPAPPTLAKAMPAADAEFGPVLGTAGLPAEAQAWIWSPKKRRLVISPRLRRLVTAAVEDGQVAFRRYALAGKAGTVVDLTLVPFKRRRALSHYLDASTRDTLGRAHPKRPIVGKNGIKVFIVPPLPGGVLVYHSEFRRGKTAVEISCFAPYGKAPEACAGAVQDMADKVTNGLGAR